MLVLKTLALVGASQTTVDGCEIQFETMGNRGKRCHLQGNHQKPEFLRWCRISSIHSRNRAPVWMALEGKPKGNHLTTVDGYEIQFAPRNETMVETIVCIYKGIIIAIYDLTPHI